MKTIITSGNSVLLPDHMLEFPAVILTRCFTSEFGTNINALKKVKHFSITMKIIILPLTLRGSLGIPRVWNSELQKHWSKEKTHEVFLNFKATSLKLTWSQVSNHRPGLSVALLPEACQVQVQALPHWAYRWGHSPLPETASPAQSTQTKSASLSAGFLRQPFF